MSPTESLVMELLRGRERYGLELVDASGGTLKRGSVYVILARMEEKGFVDSRQEERVAGHQRAAAPALSRHAVRPEGPWRVRDAARRAGAQADGGAMSFESCVIAFADRFLSDRTFELIVAPALADLQFDEDAGGAAGWPAASRCSGRVAGGFATRCVARLGQRCSS